MASPVHACDLAQDRVGLPLTTFTGESRIMVYTVVPAIRFKGVEKPT